MPRRRTAGTRALQEAVCSSRGSRNCRPSTADLNLSVGEPLLERAAALLGELVLRPRTQNGRFTPEYLEGEKANLIDRILQASQPVRKPMESLPWVTSRASSTTLGSAGAPLALPWSDLMRFHIQDRLLGAYQAEFQRRFSLEGLRRARDEGRQKTELLCQWRSAEDYRYISVTAYFGQGPKASDYTVLALQDVDKQMRREQAHQIAPGQGQGGHALPHLAVHPDGVRGAVVEINGVDTEIPFPQGADQLLAAHAAPLPFQALPEHIVDILDAEDGVADLAAGQVWDHLHQVPAVPAVRAAAVDEVEGLPAGLGQGAQVVGLDEGGEALHVLRMDGAGPGEPLQLTGETAMARLPALGVRLEHVADVLGQIHPQNLPVGVAGVPRSPLLALELSSIFPLCVIFWLILPFLCAIYSMNLRGISCDARWALTAKYWEGWLMESRDYENILGALPDTGVYVIREEDRRILYFIIK